MNFRYLGPGSTRSASPASTERLVSDAYATDVKLAVLRTKQEMRQRGHNVTDAEAYSLVEKRIASGETGVLPNFEKVLDRAAHMQTADDSPRIYGGAAMSDETANVALNPNQESNR